MLKAKGFECVCAYDGEEGYVEDETFASYYDTKLTLAATHFEDIETADAKIIDLHDKDASGAYAKTVASLEAMKKAVDIDLNANSTPDWSVEIAMYMKDGATVIFVTDVVAE